MSDVSPIKSKPAGLSGERRQVTVMFADMVGFTAASERLGEEGTYALIQPIYELMAAAVGEQGGSVKDFTGDGIMALFGAPLALEDGPLRACRAALAIHERLAARASAIEASHGVLPQMRIGLNTGLAVITQVRTESSGVTALGDTVNLASRLQTVAEPGTAVLSEATHRLVQGLVETSFAGEHVIKGKSEPQKVWRLDAIKRDVLRFDAALSRGLTDYVGRARELRLLEGSRPTADAAQRIVDIVGEAGMGKSRLLHEFSATIDRDTTTVIKGRCTPDGRQTPLQLFIDLLRSSYRLGVADSEAEIDQKLSAGLAILGPESVEDRALLLNLMGLKVPAGALKGLDGALIGLRTRELLRRLLAARCNLTPTIMIFEDVHWIDSASEELLEKLVAAGTRRPLLVLSTRRPEYRPLWLGGVGVETLALEPLSAADTGRIVQQRIGVAALPDALIGVVLDKAEGNALFAEEMVSHLLESGVVRRIGDQLDFDAAAVVRALPPSVQALLTARVDRLEPGDRALLQAAAVIGRRFDPDLLSRMTSAPGGMDRSLAAAGALDLVHVDAKTGDYVFKHALVRDALYDSLLSGPRAALHLRAAEEIERRSGNRIGEVVEVLAHHYGQTSDHAKAFTYLAMAGAKSLGIYSLDQAEAYLRRAEALLDQTPDCATDDQFATFLTNALLLPHLNYEPRRVVEMCRKYSGRIDALGDRVESVIARHYDVWAHVNLCAFAEARHQQERVTAMADRLGDDTPKAYAAAGAFFLAALYDSSSTDIVARGDTAIAIASRTEDAYIDGQVRFMVAWNAFHRGHILRARTLADDLRRIGSDRGDPRSTGMGLWLQAWIAINSDDGAEALRCSDEGIAVAITPFDRLGAELTRAVALVLLRRIDEAAPLLDARRDESERHGRRYELTGYGISAGFAMVMQGRFAAGARYIEQGIATWESEGLLSVADWFRMGLARLYLEVLDGKERPPLGVILRNIGFIAKIKITGRAKAIKLLQGLLNSDLYLDDPQNFHTGEINYLLALCYQGAKKRDAAKAHFIAARSFVEQHGPSPTLDRIDAALAAYAAG